MVAMALFAVAAPSGATLPASAATEPDTIVSLTFDDGWNTQLQAARYLADQGMQGTFYVNSEQIGDDAYLSLDELRAIAAAGHEIAGHTLTHAHLPQLSADDVRREVCDDRANLDHLGFRPTSFAYPYGEMSRAAMRIVRACGYTNARGVSGLYNSRQSCSQCPSAETLPLMEPFNIRTAASVRQPDPVGQIKDQVRRAVRVGGWLPLVFHHICADKPAPCNEEQGIRYQDLIRVVDWLSTQPVTVRPVREVAGGEFQPVVGAVTAHANSLLLQAGDAAATAESESSSMMDLAPRAAIGTVLVLALLALVALYFKRSRPH
jgi:hypothetical protein